ncbi:helix-turn-helix domain-containing protein [Nonomuraea sp. CA-143628]|uniref:helix-turn-helix domain-containing protein n=1 Tax=Nonomuraea sp. CA-143628 TaxID=3239997 RepID=UPI003D8C9FFE
MHPASAVRARSVLKKFADHNRVRVSRALTYMDQGETDLAALAIRLGFNDQSHLTRVMRDELGHTPGQRAWPR